MRGKRLGLGIAGATIFATFLAAQQKPIQGCNAALTCSQPRGYTTTRGNAGSVLFGVGVQWGPGFHFVVVTPTLSYPTPEPTPNLDARTFRLEGVSLLPPPPPTTPTPTPVPKPASKE
jgi:hypothetical protein